MRAIFIQKASLAMLRLLRGLCHVIRIFWSKIQWVRRSRANILEFIHLLSFGAGILNGLILMILIYSKLIALIFQLLLTQ